MFDQNNTINYIGKFYQSTRKSSIIVFNNFWEVATIKQVNDQWHSKYYAIPTKMIDYGNNISIFDTREELSSIFIEVINISGNVVEAKFHGFRRDRYVFPQTPVIKNLSELPENINGYMHIDDFMCYTKEVSPVYEPTLLETELIRVCKSIIHTGDCGICYYSAKKKRVIWVASDGDGHDGTTSMRKIKKRFMEIDGVEKVKIWCEATPENPSYEQIIY